VNAESSPTATCGCFTGIDVETPVDLTNLPGLAAIAYRVGTHATFKASVLANLTNLVEGVETSESALADLRTRRDDDFSIALLDAWAAVADVLTFYEERIANESYLRTATERRSILELARLIGYELRPGVAAATDLAFSVDSTSIVPTTIAERTRVQSIPDPGQQPVTFESVEQIEARSTWNKLAPARTTRQPLPYQGDRLLFEGTNTGLKPGDGVAFVGDDGATKFGLVVTVEPKQGDGPDPNEGITTVRLELVPGQPQRGALASPAAQQPQPSPLVAGYLGRTVTESELAADAVRASFEVRDLFENLETIELGPQQALVLRTRAAVFGHNAPRYDSLPDSLIGNQVAYTGNPAVAKAIAAPYASREATWSGDDLEDYSTFLGDALEAGSTRPSKFMVRKESGKSGMSYFKVQRTFPLVALDTVYTQIAGGTQVVLRSGDDWAIYSIQDALERSYADLTLSGKISILRLDTTDKLDTFTIAATTVYAQADWLPLARIPDDTAVGPTSIRLGAWTTGLRVGQRVIVAGTPTDAAGTTVAETAKLSAIVHHIESDGGTELSFSPPLQSTYVRKSVSINANVARATHGETRAEILGSGDASQPFQRFQLRQAPLTYTSGSTSSGAQSSLQLWVDDVRWDEVPTLFGHAPAERVYTVRRQDDGTATIEGGDGVTGAKFPSENENVRAVYRKGIGIGGLVRAGQLSLLVSPPLGVTGVTNPLPAVGADDPERLEDARSNAPFTVLALDRIVSLRDYENFARAFAGVAKALATWTHAGEVRGVFVTVAGPRGASVTGDTYTNLLDAMAGAGDPYVPVRVATFAAATFTLDAAVQVDPARDPKLVIPAVEQALRTAFSFDARAFGQAVALSEVIAVMQDVRGVTAVEVFKLYRLEDPPGLPTNGLLPSRLPTPGPSLETMLPAELLTLDQGPITLGTL
jgi:hypothetical protein